MENCVLKRLKNIDISQKEIFKSIMAMSNRKDNLTGILPHRHNQTENVNPTSALIAWTFNFISSFYVNLGGNVLKVGRKSSGGTLETT